MAAAMKKPDYGDMDMSPQRIRIILSSKDVKLLENVCTKLIQSAKKTPIKVKGPIRMPTKVLRITTRKSPCGEGTNTWDRFEMRIHKRVVDFHATSDAVMQITKHQLEPGVIADVNVKQ
mmetsp:Transcript_7075/g.21582  ORF Transcript_7075/g.21582 Transcript_7075/m.21582 type:complete len:119 (+) Transcript_7075:162-518(+)